VDESLLARLRVIVLRQETRAERARLAAELIRHATRARWVGIYTVADGTVSNDGWSGPNPPAHPTFPGTRGLTSHAIRARAIAVSNDVTQDPRYLTNQDDSGSELIIPVTDGDVVVGTLDIESGDIGAFSGAEISRYEMLARTLGPLWEQHQDRRRLNDG
jgi:putative methionine-R-sulfoxide reductase with GAF domain